MSDISPALRQLIQQWFAQDAARAGPTHAGAEPVVRACQRLRGPLIKLAGAAGFSSLLSRALALTKRQTSSLEGLRVQADGTLGGFEGIPENGDGAEAARQGGVILISELLGLLVTFIGEPLTLTIVREAWSAASIETPTPSTEEKP